MNLIFLGPPGSGKGTQSLYIKEEYGINPISTGEMLRKEIEKGTEVSKEIKKYLSQGVLVPEKTILRLLAKEISKEVYVKGFLLDGFPRNLNQAKLLEKLINKINKKINKVFNFEVNEDVLLKRISGRYSCSICNATYNKYFKDTLKNGICDFCGSETFKKREDDEEEIFKSRIKIYEQNNKEIVEYYSKKYLIVSINAILSPDIIFQNIKKELTT